MTNKTTRPLPGGNKKERLLLGGVLMAVATQIIGLGVVLAANWLHAEKQYAAEEARQRAAMHTPPEDSFKWHLDEDLKRPGDGRFNRRLMSDKGAASGYQPTNDWTRMQLPIDVNPMRLVRWAIEDIFLGTRPWSMTGSIASRPTDPKGKKQYSTPSSSTREPLVCRSVRLCGTSYAGTPPVKM